jgi:hypothetical protein
MEENLWQPFSYYEGINVSWQLCNANKDNTIIFSVFQDLNTLFKQFINFNSK